MGQNPRHGGQYPKLASTVHQQLLALGHYPLT